MISTLQGELLARQGTSVILEVGGIGFEVFMSARDIASLPEPGEKIRILTKLVVRDDALVLYGFASAEARSVFEKLTGVSGVGPKVALAVLSTYSPAEVANHVESQDVTAVQRVPGVGKKMASRIILELKGSLDALSGAVDDSAPIVSTTVVDGVMEALLSMGFTQTEAELSLKGHPENDSESALLQYALRRLGD